MLESSPWEICYTCASFLILIIYHIHWIYLIYHKPLTTSVGITNHLRGHWVEHIMEEKLDILAVQTLRNWVMASSFLASTGILICLGLLSVAASPEKMAEITPSLSMLVREHRVLWLFKLMVLIVDFFFIFFSFCMAIRYFNHVNFMINVPSSLAHKITPDYITDILNNGTMHYTMGMRGYYFAVLLFLWLFGPIWMLIGTIVMVIVLYHLDRKA
ncbi:MAG: DUF599 domain-containing protein [Syntrophobacterales bacterium]|jgi:uncharacterized membrane protein|nr:DUF599 domain-containing protein [Syntrophobacterales bacterium]